MIMIIKLFVVFFDPELKLVPMYGIELVASAVVVTCQFCLNLIHFHLIQNTLFDLNRFFWICWTCTLSQNACLIQTAIFEFVSLTVDSKCFVWIRSLPFDSKRFVWIHIPFDLQLIQNDLFESFHFHLIQNTLFDFVSLPSDSKYFIWIRFTSVWFKMFCLI